MYSIIVTTGFTTMNNLCLNEREHVDPCLSRRSSVVFQGFRLLIDS